MDFVFQWILFLLPLAPLMGVIWLLMFKRSRAQLANLIAPALQAKLMPPFSNKQFYVQLTCVVLGLSLLIFAAARPRWGLKEEKVFTRGRNLLIALDVSRSMLAADVHPNRLERAKADIMDLIDELKGDRAGLLAFRNKGALLCPLTTDYSFLRQALDGVSIESAPRGETDLGDAIRKALEALDPALDEYNAIILISDGEDLKGGAIEAAQESAKRNIPIFTVGIGDASGVTIPALDGSGVQQYKGSDVKTKLMDETLSAIATASKGRYIGLGTAGTAHTTLGSIYRRHLRQIAAKEQQELQEKKYQERYQFFLIPALLAILSAALFSRGRLSGCHNRKVVAALTTLLLAHAAHAETNRVDETATASTNAPSRQAIVVEPGRAGARKAQSWYHMGKYRDAAEAFLSAARGADQDEAETYRFNAAVAYYHAGATNEVVDLCNPLLTSKQYGAKAGELLGKMEMEQARKAGAEDPAAKLKALESAALGFQRALRDNATDERSNRNFSRAASQLPEARDTAHIAAVMKEFGQTSPDQLLATQLREQRAILEESYTLMTNDAPLLVRKAEALAKRQEKQADLWIPLKQQILQAVTNQQQQAQLAQNIELGRDSMKGATLALRDILPDAAAETAQSEPLVYTFWKACAQADSLVDEAILCQSNTIKKIDARYMALRGKDTQPEAQTLTHAFKARFPQWAENYRKQAQSDTNMPPFSAEDQKKIEELTDHALKLQGEILDSKTVEKDRPTLRQQAYQDLVEIRDLLPKKPNSGQNQQQQQQQNQQQQNKEQQQQEQKQEEQQQEQKQEEQQAQEKKEETPKDAQEVLRRALEREKEHENEKKRRQQRIPMSPSERDW